MEPAVVGANSPSMMVVFGVYLVVVIHADEVPSAGYADVHECVDSDAVLVLVSVPVSVFVHQSVELVQDAEVDMELVAVGDVAVGAVGSELVAVEVELVEIVAVPVSRRFVADSSLKKMDTLQHQAKRFHVGVGVVVGVVGVVVQVVVEVFDVDVVVVVAVVCRQIVHGHRTVGDHHC